MFDFSQDYSIFIPALFMVLLTFLVLLFMFYKRIIFISANKVSMGKFRTRSSTQVATADIASSADNFMNLFEMPVLFYFLTCVIFLTNQSDQLYLILMSAYVFFRYLHSLIHCTFNNVNFRFYAYAVSVMMLMIVFTRLFFKLVF